MPYIDHPARQEGPASIMDWLRYNIGTWMQAKGYAWEKRALYPDRKCDTCGKPQYKGDHRACDELPF